ASGAQFYTIWSHAYGLRALAVALRDGAPGAAPEALRAKARELIRVLRIYQSPEGGFGYLDFRAPGYKPSWSTSFTTATCLVALHEARAAGLTVPQELIDGGVRNILMCRTPEGSFLYGSYMRYSPARGINRPKGSSMRTPACNLALWLSGRKASEKELRTGLEQLVRHHRFAVAGVRRPIPHESWYQVSGYFYLYGHLYAAMVLEHLPAEDRARFWPHLVRSVLKCRQNDGSFWDYPTYGYHKAYGTGYALMTLARCPPAIAARLRPEKG
ncbi:MAG: prenyltransferase/squalene oxidase repeat-containing protein, partial [Planctomycetota bacterium]